MTGWWLPVPMLALMERLVRGETLTLNDKGCYVWKSSRRSCTGTAKAMIQRGLIAQSGFRGEISVTAHGRNELTANKGRMSEINAYIDGKLKP